jgi:lipopolysaccharide biosynthesis protein
LQTVTRNQQKLAEKWATLLQDINTTRVIAFYLPQFHSTPENDFHWGQGFTEWTNVAKAAPGYVGHYQPHLPADLGFYDLRVRQTIERQATLGHRYGISGFCIYYYNFGQQRALDRAFEMIVGDQTIPFPYCICWANENWTRHWDGGSREIIFEQQYNDDALYGVLRDAVRYAKDPRYIRVNGKPLFLVYRPMLIPDPHTFAKITRRAFHEAGHGGVHLVYVESMEAATKGLLPADRGFDASVEFPPHGLSAKAEDPVTIIRGDFIGTRYDYEATILADIRRPLPDYKRYPCVFPSWDNTPRQPQRGDSFVNATPEAFQVYVEEKLEYIRRFLVGEERLLFVNAWNEWAEGCHLEPDRKFGHRWLEAIRNALMVKSLA